MSEDDAGNMCDNVQINMVDSTTGLYNSVYCLLRCFTDHKAHLNFHFFPQKLTVHLISQYA